MIKWLKSIFNRPTVQPQDPAVRLVPIPYIQAGVRVDHDQALTYSAIFGAVRVISETIATLSWHAFDVSGRGGKQRATGNLEGLLNKRPNPEMSGMAFRETMIAWALTWGNGYAEIVRDAAGRPAELWPIAPDRVEVKRTESGQLLYEISNARGPKSYLMPEQMFHLHGLGFDGRTGYSVITLASRGIGLGIAAEEFGASFFGNNTQLGGVLTHPNTLSDEAYERLRSSWELRHKGAAKSWKPAILEEGMTWHSTGVPPEDAQYLETRKFGVNEVCRWFRIPPHKLGDLDRATFSNIEHQSIEFVSDCLMPWIVRLEQEANTKLISNRTPGRYTKINVNALLRGDAKTRAEHYQIMQQLGVYSVNEIRELEDMNPIPDGDARIVPMNMTTLEKLVNAQEEPEQPEEPQVPDMEDIEAVFRFTLKAAIRREINRTENEANGRTRQEFIAALAKQEKDYQQYLAKNLAEPLDLFERKAKPQNKQAVIEVVNDYIKGRVAAFRQQAIEYYDQRITIDDRQAASREAAILLENLKRVL